MGCEKELQPVQIAVSTGDATNITTNSASIQVGMDKNDLINEIGVFCSTDSLFNSNTVNKSSTQTITGTHFNFQLSNLSDGTKYFYKAYASGKSNSIYGITKSFTTEQLQLSTSINNIEAGDLENTYSVKINSNTDWHASSNQNWCEVSPNTGTTNSTINILLKANTTTSARQAIVTVTAGNKEQKITINQKGCHENLAVSSNYFSVSPENKSYNFVIYTNLSWEASSDQSWCVLSSSSGNGENTLSFTVSENTTGLERKAVVKVKSGSLTQEITIIQQSKSATLSVSTNIFSVNADRNTYNFSITSNLDWTITSDQSWCTPSIAAGSNNQTVSFVVSENTSTQERMAMISVKAGTLLQQITVTQTGTNQTLAVSKNSFLFGSEIGQGEFTISSNTNWNISSDKSWCSVATTSGSNNKTVSFSITENTSTQRRTAIITINTSSSSIQIVVTQEGKTEVLPNLSVSPGSISVTASEQTSSFDITSNSNWTIASNQTWCTPSVTSGNGDKTITCSVSANTSSQSRTATVTITTGNLSRTVTVLQEGKDVVIVNIPDANFKACLVENFDYDKDGEISEKEASSTGVIHCENKNIYSLEGIQYFTSLALLYCEGNNLSEINISNNPKIEILSCGKNNLSKIDISKNTNLEYLSINDNQLTDIDISNNVNLKSLNCSNNQLKKINTTTNNKLKRLQCSYNNITELNLQNNILLESLDCSNNCMSYLDINSCVNLKSFTCYGNVISELDVSKNIILEYIGCSYNNISYLDVSSNTKIVELNCHHNQISELVLPLSINLNLLACHENKIESLDVSYYVNLETLYCDNNNLPDIDLSNNLKLSIVDCYSNPNMLHIYLKQGQSIEKFKKDDHAEIIYK